MQITNSRQNLYSLVLAIAILALFSLAIFLPLRPIGYALPEWNMTYHAENQRVRLPVSRTIQPGISEMHLSATFPNASGDTLVLPRISGNAVEVFLNGKRIYRLGDFNAPTAKLWNGQLIVMLPGPLQAENQLDIHIASVAYGIGLSAVPYLAPYPQAAQRVTVMNWISNDLLMMTTGAAFVVGLMLLISCLLRRQWKTPEFFIGIGLLCCVGLNQEVYYKITSGDLVSFFWSTKLRIVCGYLAGLFLICGLEYYERQGFQISRWVARIVAVCGLALLATPNFYWFTRVNLVITGLIFVMMSFASFFVIKSPERSAWLRLISCLIALSIFQIFYGLWGNTAMPIFLPYSISLSTLIVGIHLMVEYNHLFNENRTLQHNNQLDPLTGAYNRRVLQEIDPEIYHFAVVIDLNDFKALNDSRGHIVGDQVLSDFTQVIRDNLRQDDLVIRWGGDEFLLVFANLPETSNSYQMVENILQRVSDQFDGSHPGLDLSFSYGIVMVQASLEHSLEEADRRMYAMKEIHHNRASADFIP